MALSSQCRGFLGQPETNAAYRTAAEAVLPTLVNRRIASDDARAIQRALMAYLRVADLSSDSCTQILLTILGNADIFNEAVHAQPEVQDPRLVERVGALLLAGRIRPDSESINRFAKWVQSQWEQTNKESLASVVAHLCSSYPEHEAIWQLMLTPREDGG
ncbi:MAG: hypothetical protein AAB393_17300 [Bacteroidota bacterium]